MVVGQEQAFTHLCAPNDDDDDDDDDDDIIIILAIVDSGVCVGGPGVVCGE